MGDERRTGRVAPRAPRLARAARPRTSSTWRTSPPAAASPGKYGWPLVDHIDYTHLQYGLPALAAHPYDDGVLISGATVLDEVPDEVDAVVSLCLTGRTQVPAGLEHINFRLMDEADPEQNPNLDFVLMDAARLVADLRDEGKTVLLHCVAAHSRTPTVAIAYAMLRGVPLDEAMPAVCGVLPAARPQPGVPQCAESAVCRGKCGLNRWNRLTE